MSTRRTKLLVNANDRVTLDCRHHRYLDKFTDGILVESDDDGPRTVIALTWTDLEQRLHSRRLIVHKGYYGTKGKEPVGKTMRSEEAERVPTPSFPQSLPKGLDVRPMDILEMDDGRIDVRRVGLNLGFWNRLHPEVQARLGQVPFVWGTAAMDACTRLLCGIHLTVEVPSVASVISTLAMAVREKGAEKLLHHGRANWFQGGRPGQVHIDGAPPYNSAAFVGGVIGLTGSDPIPSNQHPHLRARVERMFRSLTSARFGSLPDVVGNSILLVENYDPAKHSHLTDKELLDQFAHLIVERYHNIPQRALDGQTPLECWLQMSCEGEGVPPPPSKEEYRGLFGIKLRRRVTARGVSILGIEYRSAHLKDLHMWHHRAEVELSVDESDISAISFRDPRDGCWHQASAMLEGLNSVPLSEWMETIRHVTSHLQRTANANWKIDVAALNDLKGRTANL